MRIVPLRLKSSAGAYGQSGLARNGIAGSQCILSLARIALEGCDQVLMTRAELSQPAASRSVSPLRADIR